MVRESEFFTGMSTNGLQLQLEKDMEAMQIHLQDYNKQCSDVAINAWRDFSEDDFRSVESLRVAINSIGFDSVPLGVTVYSPPQGIDSLRIYPIEIDASGQDRIIGTGVSDVIAVFNVHDKKGNTLLQIVGLQKGSDGQLSIDFQDLLHDPFSLPREQEKSDIVVDVVDWLKGGLTAA